MAYVSLNNQVMYNPLVASSKRSAVAVVKKPEVVVLSSDEGFSSNSDNRRSTVQVNEISLQQPERRSVGPEKAVAMNESPHQLLSAADSNVSSPNSSVGSHPAPAPSQELPAEQLPATPKHCQDEDGQLNHTPRSWGPSEHVSIPETAQRKASLVISTTKSGKSNNEAFFMPEPTPANTSPVGKVGTEETNPDFNRQHPLSHVPCLSENVKGEENRAQAQDALPSEGERSPPPLHHPDAEVDVTDNNETESHGVVPTSSRRRPARSAGIVDYNEDSGEELETGGNRFISETHLPRRRRRRQSPEKEGVGAYQPSEASEKEQESDAVDEIPSPPRKRRRMAGRQSRSTNNATKQREVRTSASNPAWEHFTPPHALSPPYSQDCGGSDIETVQAPAAEYQQWRLGDAVVKCIVMDGKLIIQVEGIRNPCRDGKHNASRDEGMQSNTVVKSRRSTQRGTQTTSKWTHKEEELLIRLKKQGLAWSDIHEQFTKAFPKQKRSVGTLQVRYSTKLKARS